MTRRPPRSATKSCFVHGSAKPLGSRLNVSPRSGVRAIASSSRRRARSGVPSILKPAGQCECPGKCARNFPSDSGCLTSRLAIASCTLMTFFAHPARVGLIILTLTGAIAFGFSGSSSVGIGQREDPSSRWIFIPLIIIAVAFAWLPPHLDRLNRWTIDGNTVRYLGLIITAIGGFVRVATVFELGHRFSIFVAVQSDHRLKINGFYRFVRHPSYLWALLAMAGWALVFRR